MTGGFPMKHSRKTKKRAGEKGTAFLIFAVALVAWIVAPAQSDPAVDRNLKDFFEAFLGRNLSGGEQREVVDEFIRYHTGKGKARPAIEEAARTFGSFVKILRDGKGGPADF